MTQINQHEVINKNENSLEVTKNSRGYNYSIKVYGNNLEEIKTKFEELREFAENKINILKKLEME